METVFSVQYVIELGGRKYAEELVMIRLLDTFQFQIILVTLTNSLLTTFLIGRFTPPQLALTFIDSTLLCLHFFVNRKELGCLLRGQKSLFRDKLLKVSLKLLRRELLLLLLWLCHDSNCNGESKHDGR